VFQYKAKAESPPYNFTKSRLGHQEQSMQPSRQQTRWKVWAAFAGLCLLVSSSRLLPSVAAEGASSIAQQSCFYGVVGFIALIIAGGRLLVRIKQRKLLLLQLAGVSILLLGMPAIVSEWARDGLSDITQAALFALVPFLVVVVAMGREPIAGEDLGVRRFFVPALAGFGGVLLLLPFSFPVSLRGRIMWGVLLVAIILVGFASEWIYRLLRGFEMMEAFSIVCLSNAVFLAACSFSNLPSAESWSGASSLISLSSLCYLLELLLLVWLFREMPPVRLAARFLVVPLLVILEGLVILRPALTVRMAAGLILLAGGAGYLLLSKIRDTDAVLSIR
jgi:drug/metabolite transporter (DMT)-like permease